MDPLEGGEINHGRASKFEVCCYQSATGERGPHFTAVTAEINGVCFRRTIIKDREIFNVMPISIFEICKKSNNCLVMEEMPLNPINVQHGLPLKLIGHVTVRLQVGEIISDTRFYVLDRGSPFHLMLGREWVEEHQVIPYPLHHLHQCFNAKFQGKEVVIKASQISFFERDEHDQLEEETETKPPPTQESTC